MRAPMQRLALFATLAFTASTAAALPTDDGNTRPAPPSPTMGSPDALRRRQEPNTDGRSHHRAYPRGGFVAVDAGLTLARTTHRHSARHGLGFTSARASRGRWCSLAAPASRSTPPARRGAAAARRRRRLGVDVRAWRTVWLGAGLAARATASTTRS
jgi:hypothetical protein